MDRVPEVVAITGASAGVGRATVQRFAREKAHIGLLARGEDGLEAARREVEEAGGRALALPTDVAKADQVEAGAAAIEREFGPIDIWINDAMVIVFSPFLEITPDEFHRATEVTYLGYVYGTMSALKRMVPRNRGTVVQVGSALAYRSIPLQSAYCGAKAAIRGFTDSIRTELRHARSVVYQTRTISRYRYLIDGKQPRPAALSAVRENSWVGYYIAPAPGESSDTEHTIEMRVSRLIGSGLNEEIDLTNYTQKAVALTLAIEVDADFGDQSEMGSGKNTAQGSIKRRWQRRDEKWELCFDFHAEHAYDHQGEKGVAHVRRSIALQIEHSGSAPSYQEGRISFQIELQPQASWHACLNVISGVQGKVLEPVRRRHGFDGIRGELDYEREKFLTEGAARFRSVGSGTLAASVMHPITRSSRDLASLRLHDLNTDGG